jgi:hypothetical protein
VKHGNQHNALGISCTPSRARVLSRSHYQLRGRVLLPDLRDCCMPSLYSPPASLTWLQYRLHDPRGLRVC